MSDRLRALQWGVIALALFAVVFGFNLQETAPGVQSTLYNVATICIRGWVGYWLARTVLGRLNRYSNGSAVIARAILIGAVVLTAR